MIIFNGYMLEIIIISVLFFEHNFCINGNGRELEQYSEVRFRLSYSFVNIYIQSVDKLHF